jgi:hypothetical protein
MRCLPDEGEFMAAFMRANPPQASESPDTRMWPLEAQLLGQIIDLLAAANWQRGGGKGSRPKSILTQAPQRPSQSVMSNEDMRAYLDRMGPQASQRESDDDEPRADPDAPVVS